MKRLSISVRFTLAIVIFSIPIVTLMIYMWKVNQEVLMFSQKELEGIQHLMEGAQVKEKAFQLHFRVATSQPPTAEEWAQHRKEWEAFIETLDDVSLDRKQVFASIDRYLEAPHSEKIKGDVFLRAISELGVVRQAIVDSHNIMLDPDSDSFYTMDNIVSKLPQVHTVQAFLLSLVSSGDTDPSASVEKLKSQFPLFNLFIDRARANLEKAKEFDQKYYGISPSFQKNYERYIDNISQQKKALENYQKNPDLAFANPVLFEKEVKKSFELNSQLILDLQKEFQNFVQNRYNIIESDMHKRLGFSVAALIFATLFSSYLGYTIFTTIRTFKTAVHTLKGESQQALSTGEALIQASQQVSNSSREQAAAIEETSASLEEISSMVRHNGDNAKSAQDVSTSLSQEAQKGALEMQELTKKMNEISKSSKRIEEIMTIIDDIAFQTNLLSLNASVEAARAGEHGRGFAVVADAVRTLAQRSSVSAKEIASLIKTSLQQIEEGRQSADRTEEVMSSILKSIQKVSSLNTEIAHASQEQTAGVMQISQAISSLERTTVENSGVATSASEYSQKSLAQAEGLLRLVAVLEAELAGRKLGSTQSDDHQDLNFDEAIQAHLKWKGRLKNFISGVGTEKLVSTHVCKDNQCQLGEWIYGPGAAYKNLTSYHSLRENHAHFHIAAGEVIKAFEAGDQLSAQRLLTEGSDFDRQTRFTVDSIQKLKQDIQKQSKAS